MKVIEEAKSQQQDNMELANRGQNINFYPQQQIEDNAKPVVNNTKQRTKIERRKLTNVDTRETLPQKQIETNTKQHNEDNVNKVSVGNVQPSNKRKWRLADAQRMLTLKNEQKERTEIQTTNSTTPQQQGGEVSKQQTKFTKAQNSNT